MSKHHKKKEPKATESTTTKRRPKQSPKRNWMSIGLLVLGALFGIAYIYSSFNVPNANARGRAAIENIRANSTATNTAPAEEPKFVHEGEVKFLNEDGSEKIKIDVEIADNEADREQGLMYRSKMEANQGMLFTFDKEKPQSFWMKNTKISLDIIYIDKDYKVVSIQKNTKPFSEGHLPSTGLAQYVVEVNAGFCDQHNIKAGDLLSF